MALHITNLGNYNVTLKFYDWKSTWQSWMNEQGMKSLDKVEFMVAEGANRQSDWGNGSIWKAVKTYTNATPDSLNNITFTFDVSKYVTPASGRFVSFKILMTYTRSSDNVSGNYLHSTGYQASIIANTFGVNALFVYANANSTPTNLSLTSTTNKLSAPIHISYNNSSGGTWGTKYRIFLSLCKDAALNEGVYHTVVESTSSTSFDYDLRNYLIIAEMESNIRDYKDLYVKLWVTAIDNYGLTESVRAECSTILHLYNDTYNVFSKTADGQKAIGMSNIIHKDSLISTGMKVKVLEDGSKWGRIFWHDVSTTSTWFASAAEAKDCNLSNRFSKLGNIANYFHNGKYEFMLVYPKYSTTKYNRWAQVANPLIAKSDATQTAETMGYKAAHIDFPINWKFGMGLSSSSNNAFMDCEAGHVNWFGGLGLYSAFQGGFPAPTENGMSNVQKEVELWVRIYNEVKISPKPDGSKIYLKTASDFYTFCNNVGSGNTYKGKTVYLLTDVTTSGASEHKVFYPAGDIDHPFEGTFDGQGHTLNLVYMDNDNKVQYIGFLGYNKGTVKNLSVSTMYIQNARYGGTICGRNDGIIENCQASGSISFHSGTSTLYSGGITGSNNGTIMKCLFKGSVSSPTSGGGISGGIAGENVGKIISCRAIGDISGYEAGGIVGYNYSIGSEITRCVNFATFGSATANTGGIVGVAYRGALTSCLNAGSGASAGIIGNNTYVTTENCYYASDYNKVGVVYAEAGHTDTTHSKTLASMKSQSMADTLGKGFFFYDDSYDKYVQGNTKQFIKFNWEKITGFANGEGCGAETLDGNRGGLSEVVIPVTIYTDLSFTGGISDKFELFLDGKLCRVIKNPPRKIDFKIYPSDGIVADKSYPAVIKWHHYIDGTVTTMNETFSTYNGLACFIEGTKILTATILKPIEDIAEGDYVLSKNEQGQIEEQRVYHIYNHNPRSCL